MKLLSLNCRGLESTQKKLALKRVILVHKPDVILLQEIMGPEVKVTTLLTSILKYFSFVAQSARGHSGGLEIGWNHSTVQCLNSWGALFGLGI